MSFDRQRYRRAFALVACVTLTVAAIPVAGHAQAVPPHLTSMAVDLMRAVEKDLDAAAGDQGRAWVVTRAREAMAAKGMNRWGRSQIVISNFAAPLAELLELDLAESGDREALAAFLARDAAGETEEAIRDVYRHAGREDPTDDQIASIMEKTGELRAAAIAGMAKSHTLVNEADNTRIGLRWKPEEAQFSITVENPGDTFIEPYQTVLVGDVEPSMNEDGDALVLEVVPSPDPIIPLVLEDLEAIERNVYGEWVDQDRNRWFIAPPPGEETPETAVEHRPSEAATRAARITAVQDEIAKLRESKVYVWENVETEETQRQPRFRRLKDPWNYLGEDYAEPDTADRIDALETEIADLAEPPQQPPVEQHDPVGFAETAGGASRPVRVSVTEADGCAFTYDQAFYSGTRVTGRRTIRQHCDLSSLPPEVQRQLLASWSPPEWFELTLRPDPRSGELSVSGQRWRLHVTYSGDTLEVGRIHTPYPKSLTLQRPPRKAP